MKCMSGEPAKEAKVTTLMKVLTAAALLAAMAAPAVAQEKEKVYKSDGKRWFLVERAVMPAAVEPATALLEVARGERKEGDIPGMKYVGKTPERATFRRVPAAEEAAARGHRCDTRALYVKKWVEFRHFCRVDGSEMACPGMNKAGECLAVVK
jgi:hypothetical protein